MNRMVSVKIQTYLGHLKHEAASEERKCTELKSKAIHSDSKTQLLTLWKRHAGKAMYQKGLDRQESWCLSELFQEGLKVRIRRR